MPNGDDGQQQPNGWLRNALWGAVVLLAVANLGGITSLYVINNQSTENRVKADQNLRDIEKIERTDIGLAAAAAERTTEIRNLAERVKGAEVAVINSAQRCAEVHKDIDAMRVRLDAMRDTLAMLQRQSGLVGETPLNLGDGLR